MLVGKKIIDKDRFKLVYLYADVENCKNNDKYGLYKLSEEGKLNNLVEWMKSMITLRNLM